MDRLLLIHDIITRVLGGLYRAPIDKDKTKRILDLGTGTGICMPTTAATTTACFNSYGPQLTLGIRKGPSRFLRSSQVLR